MSEWHIITATRALTGKPFVILWLRLAATAGAGATIRDLIKHTQILPVIPWSSIPNLLTFFKGGISKVFSFPFKTRDRNQLPLALSFISPPSLLSSVDSSVRDTPETAFISYNCLAIGGHTILLRCIFTPFYLPSFLRWRLHYFLTSFPGDGLVFQSGTACCLFRVCCGQWR